MRQVLLNGLLLNGKFSGVRYSIECLLQAISAIDSNEVKVNVLLGSNYSGNLVSRNSLEILPCAVNSTKRVNRIFFENFKLPALYKKKCFEVFHSPGYILPGNNLYPSIVTVHDIIALQFPHLCTPENALYFNLMLPQTLRRSQRIIAISESVKSDIMNKFPTLDAEKISVIYQGVGKHFRKVYNVDQLNAVRLKYKLPEKFLLFVGNIEPKKNLMRLATVLHELKRHFNVAQKLVIVGTKSWGYEAFDDHLRKLRLTDDVTILGYVDDEDLPSVYSMADLFVFPSLYEGFGMPPLEAMACGTPVMVSHAGALPEVTGGHCFYTDPQSISEMTSIIYNIINNEKLRTKYCSKALEWSKNFTWHNTATKTLSEYLKTSEKIAAD